VDREISDPYALGAALRDARKRRGWTQAQLAGQAQVSRQFVVNLERGRSPRSELIRVFQVLRALDLAVLLVEAKGPSELDGLLDEVLG
jgi:HTH-type transcriptional regulator / antitoxin HipB